MAKRIELGNGVVVEYRPLAHRSDDECLLIHFGCNSFLKIEVPHGHSIEDLHVECSDGDGYRSLIFDAPND